MTSIFVAKLDFEVDNAQLQSLFEEYGKVNKATVALDRETGKSRGFGFVEMFDDTEAQDAIRGLDGYEVNGRTLAVKEAEDRSGGKPAPRRDAPRPAGNRNSSPSSSSTPFAPPSSDDAPSKDFSKKRSHKPKTTSFEPTGGGGGKKTTKLDPYKKSGKDSIHIEDEDDFEDIDLFGLNEDEDDDEDYSKYLVNAGDDDEDYDDEEYDDEDYDDED